MFGVFLQLAKKLHPDTNKSDPETEKKFQEVQAAYEVLKDDDKRQQYDQVYILLTDADYFSARIFLMGLNVEVG